MLLISSPTKYHNVFTIKWSHIFLILLFCPLRLATVPNSEWIIEITTYTPFYTSTQRATSATAFDKKTGVESRKLSSTSVSGSIHAERTFFCVHLAPFLVLSTGWFFSDLERVLRSVLSRWMLCEYICTEPASPFSTYSDSIQSLLFVPITLSFRPLH